MDSLAPRPDAVLVTGDLVERGETEEYERLRALLDPLTMPAYLIPGNHDDRENLPRVFDGHRYLPRDSGFIQYVVEDWPVRLVALDTLIPGESGGRLCAERLALARRAACRGARAADHRVHAPPTLRHRHKEDGRDGPRRRRGPRRGDPPPPTRRADRVGHLHRPIVRRFAGTVASTCPATAHQLALDLGPESRLATVMEPPACMLHAWLGEGEGLVSHLSVIGDRYVPVHHLRRA